MIGISTSSLVTVLTSQYAYVLFVAVMGIGLYMMIASPNLVKKVIGLNMFQTAIFLFFVSTAYVTDGRVPVVDGSGETLYASPLPHVIVLTAIVVGVALTAVALALIIRIYEEYGTLDETVLREVMASES